MFFPIPSDIFQNDAKMLKEQWYKIKKRHKEKQWLQAHYIECAAQKARKMAKAKIRKEIKKWRLAEEEDKRKQIKYLQ